MSSDCNFVYTLPEYVLDRTVIINGNHEHRVSGFKLAKASDYFKRQLIELRRGELEKSRIREDEKQKHPRRARARSLCDLQIEPLHVNYDDLIGFEMMLSFTHCSEEARCDLTKSLNSKQLVSILKAGTHFEVPDFVEYFIDAMKQKLTTQNVWDYWTALEPISDIAPDLTNFSRNFLLKHFLETCSSDEFLLQTADKLKLLLRDDALNASNELELFRQLERWVAVDPIKRSAHFGGLLACLRLGRLTAAELDEIKASIYVSENQQDCSRILSIAQSIVDSNTTGVNPSAQQSGDDAEILTYLKRPRLPHAAIFVVGGWEGNQDDPNFGPSRAIQVYNSRSDTWRRIASDGIALDEGHAYSGCVLYKNRIYIIGGYISSGPTQMLKVLELATGTWRYLSPMHEKRNYICACLLDNAIYALGGHNGRHRLNTVERYDPEQNNWTFVSQMRQVRSDAGADSLNGKIYVCGGFDGHHFYDSVECYDPKVDQWTLLAPMQNIRSGVSVIGFNNCLYAIGGNDGLQRLRTVERYDPETNQWQTMPSMIRQRSNFCIVAMDDSIYVMGGWSDETNSTIALVEKWVPGMQNSWEQTKELYLPASANCCCGIKGLDVIKNFL
ncbi:unnamed protein product [Mesocestoides corti]|uniref:BACK domain-containing protein n=1 Tax=Mesocestoides corti TaxID=53468 RepID=A0A0R3U798_MESCO|nr:unnamed protein product [Mesocestoides corti]